VLILVTGMLMGFTGYLLPWDQTAYWATVVGINLNGTAPFAGPWLAQFLAGGAEIGADTLPKWYALHMLLIPGALIALIGVHIYLVTRLGVASPPWSSEAAGRERPAPEPAAGARAGLVRGSGGD
jgi:quinol-cytochrome oxidoreductase complex cytochrome b subunit